MELAIPASTIASLSSGEFVGFVADNPEQKIELKAFHNQILNDHKALLTEQDKFLGLPVIKNVTAKAIQDNYLQVKKDIREMIESEMERMMNTPDMEHLIVKKGNN